MSENSTETETQDLAPDAEPNAVEPSPEPEPNDSAAEVMALRFEAAAARASIADDYVDVVFGLFRESGQEPTKDNMKSFIDALKKTKRALFGPVPASTAPAPSQAVPAAPAPGGVANPYQQWRSLVGAGRKAEAEAFYAVNRRRIQRTAQ